MAATQPDRTDVTGTTLCPRSPACALPLSRLLGGMANVIQEGVNTAQGPPHYGWAILVGMRDGRVIWYYNDGRIGGDLRNDNRADKRVRQLPKRFPAGR